MSLPYAFLIALVIVAAIRAGSQAMSRHAEPPRPSGLCLTRLRTSAKAADRGEGTSLKGKSMKERRRLLAGLPMLRIIEGGKK